jgi:hypothetical protein
MCKEDVVRFWHWRKMTWVFWIVNALFLWWLIAYAGDIASQDQKCNADQYAGACHTGTALGATMGVALLVFFWFVAFVVLSILWFIARPKTRPCPVCGNDVKKGRTVCPKCSFDFAAAMRTPVQAVADLAGAGADIAPDV